MKPTDIKSSDLTKEEMLEVIQEKVGDKTLSKGCIITIVELYQECFTMWYYTIIGLKTTINYEGDHLFGEEQVVGLELYDGNGRFKEVEVSEKYTVTGHPVMIGDVLKYFSRDMVASTPMIRFRRILEQWNFYEKSIDEQSLDCIEYIYNLVKDD